MTKLEKENEDKQDHERWVLGHGCQFYFLSKVFFGDLRSLIKEHERGKYWMQGD